LGWVQSLDWTTGLDYWTTQTAKYTSFSAEYKLNIGIYSLSYFANTVSFLEFLEVKGHVHI